MTANVPVTGTAPEGYAKLIDWVNEVAALTKPAAIHWVDGSEEERNQLNDLLVEGGTFTRLNDSKIPPTSPGWKTAPSSARSRRRTPARPTTGGTRGR